MGEEKPGLFESEMAERYKKLPDHRLKSLLRLAENELTRRAVAKHKSIDRFRNTEWPD